MGMHWLVGHRLRKVGGCFASFGNCLLKHRCGSEMSLWFDLSAALASCTIRIGPGVRLPTIARTISVGHRLT